MFLILQSRYRNCKHRKGTNKFGLKKNVRSRFGLAVPTAVMTTVTTTTTTTSSTTQNDYDNDY